MASPVLKDFLKTFLIPTLVNKAFLLFFGLNYAEYPGEGYGYGIIACVFFFFAGVGHFLWKYKDIQDP